MVIPIKKTTSYKEQNAEKVENYKKELEKYKDFNIVYLDETGFDEPLFREKVWSKKGEALFDKISGKKFQRISLVAALQGDKIIAPMNYKGTMTSEFFEKWFVEFLIKELKPNSVIILDNASFHKIQKLHEEVKKYGHTVLPLPPYSPELNEHEKCWANIKKYLRSVIHNYNTIEEAIMSYFAGE